MYKFHSVAGFEGTLYKLGLEYQYHYIERGTIVHRNRFCLLDGTVILEISIQEETGNVQIKDKQGIRDYPSLDLKDLHLMIINIGNTLTPKVPFIYIRVLAGMHVLHHSEHKQ